MEHPFVLAMDRIGEPPTTVHRWMKEVEARVRELAIIVPVLGLDKSTSVW
jgi:hypothetical protein